MKESPEGQVEVEGRPIIEMSFQSIVILGMLATLEASTHMKHLCPLQPLVLSWEPLPLQCTPEQEQLLIHCCV